MPGALTTTTVDAIMADLRRTVELPSERHQLMGPIGDNANLGFSRAGLVVRITSTAGAAKARREVRAASWAPSEDLPIVRLSREFDEQPLERNGIVVTFWEYVSDARQATPAEIGRVLRKLHSVALPSSKGFREPIDMFSRQRAHLAEASAVSPEDRDFLSGLLDRLEAEYADLPFAWPVSVVHGDPHRKNVVHGSSGVVLLDLEGMGIGHREVDLIVPAVYERVGWYSHSDYASFAEAYGYDVTGWPGFPTLAAIRELRMTLWLAARFDREPRLADEVARRIDSLRHPDAPRHWTPGT